MRNNIVRFIEKIENFDTLVKEVNEVLEKHSNRGNQVMLQTLDPDNEDWLTGIGRVEELEVQMENDYTNIQPSLKGTMLEKVINNYNGFRTRILTMKPHSCYSVHKDFTPRIHIPIVTNQHAYMTWPAHNLCYQLVEGAAYYTDTTKLHTFFNGGEEDRIHIVMCINPS